MSILKISVRKICYCLFWNVSPFLQSSTSSTFGLHCDPSPHLLANSRLLFAIALLFDRPKPGFIPSTSLGSHAVRVSVRCSCSSLFALFACLLVSVMRSSDLMHCCVCFPGVGSAKVGVSRAHGLVPRNYLWYTGPSPCTTEDHPSPS